jgi:hypothetical protein
VIWLGDKRGNLSDWVTQQWVRATGRRIRLQDSPWLDGPAGPTRRIGTEFFQSYADVRGLQISTTGVRGLLPDFTILEQHNPAMQSVAAEVRNFYEHTSEYDLDAWSEWCAAFRPFGSALRHIFSRRLQQLNVPLSPLDSAKGMTSDVLSMRTPEGRIVQTAWVRTLRATGNVLYAGSYSACTVPLQTAPCVKVVFPLPNGNAIVLMKAVAGNDGSLAVQSIGNRFGDAGFYFTVHHRDGTASARYVKTMKEEIRVYAAEDGIVRADHTLWLWGIRFLRLHYRMRRRTEVPSRTVQHDLS